MGLVGAPGPLEGPPRRFLVALPATIPPRDPCQTRRFVVRPRSQYQQIDQQSAAARHARLIDLNFRVHNQSAATSAALSPPLWHPPPSLKPGVPADTGLLRTLKGGVPPFSPLVLPDMDDG